MLRVVLRILILGKFCLFFLIINEEYFNSVNSEIEVVQGKYVFEIMEIIIDNSFYLVVLVFYEFGFDIKFFEVIKYNIYKVQNVFEIIDIKYMYQYVVCSNKQFSVSIVCEFLGIQMKNLYNVGNDVVYILQVMIGLVVKQCEESLRRVCGEGVQVFWIVQYYVFFVELVEKEGWMSGGEDFDGGCLVRFVQFEMNFLIYVLVQSGGVDDWQRGKEILYVQIGSIFVFRFWREKCNVKQLVSCIFD